MTLQELTVLILRTAGVYQAGQGDQLDPEMALDVVQRLMLMVNSLAAEGHGVFYTTKESFAINPFAPATTFLTYGVGGDFDSPRPVKVLGGYVTDVAGSDFPLEIVSRDQYNSLTIKTEIGRPYWLYYNSTFPLGACYFFYLPDQPYTVHLDTEKDMVNWSIPTDPILLPGEYVDMLHWNMAKSMLPSYPMQRPPEVVQMIMGEAARSLGVVKRLNAANRNLPVKLNAVPGQRAQGFWRQGDIKSGQSYPF